MLGTSYRLSAIKEGLRDGISRLIAETNNKVFRYKIKFKAFLVDLVLTARQALKVFRLLNYIN